ncbi:MAG TPA: hypothetical protein VGF79_11770 [Bacteroidia bacterium]
MSFTAIKFLIIPIANFYHLLTLLLCTNCIIQLNAQSSISKRHFSTNFATAYNSNKELYFQSGISACKHIYFDNQRSHPMLINAYGLDLRIGMNSAKEQQSLIYGVRLAFNFEQLFLKPNFSMKIASGWLQTGSIAYIQNALNIGCIFKLPKDNRLCILYGFEQRLKNASTRYLHELGLQFSLN